MSSATIDAAIARKLRIIPGDTINNVLVFYHDGSREEHRLKKELEFLLEKKIDLKLKPKDEIDSELIKIFPMSVDSDIRSGSFGHSLFNATEKPNDFLTLDSIVIDAISVRASDIHIERTESFGRIRFRIDGKLIERKKINSAEYPALINKIKVKSDISISEKRIPQDGRCFIETNGQKIDLRVSVMPSLFYEMVVMRILGNQSKLPSLEQLGITGGYLEILNKSLLKFHGLILISGPTGSGKTSTLYACLNELNNAERNIMTIEDPVEMVINGINQVQVKAEVGLTFSSALRAFLRQDPDVIMIGEIRDSETAEMAIRAAMTGHLVISTIHTNSAHESVSRLKDLGIPGFLIASTLTLSVAQRLVRLLCHDCKIEDVNNTYNQKYPDVTFYKKGNGCVKCNFTGYTGRTGCFEFLEIDRQLKREVVKETFNEASFNADYKSLSNSALNLLIKGLTSEEEIFPILASFNE